MTTASGARSTAPGSRCLVVVPTYNEVETIEHFLGDLLVATADLDARVLVVDDSSPVRAVQWRVRELLDWRHSHRTVGAGRAV